MRRLFGLPSVLPAPAALPLSPCLPAPGGRRGPSGGGGACRNLTSGIHCIISTKTRAEIAQSARNSRCAACVRMLRCKRRSCSSKDTACVAACQLQRCAPLAPAGCCQQAGRTRRPEAPSFRPSGWMGRWVRGGALRMACGAVRPPPRPRTPPRRPHPPPRPQGEPITSAARRRPRSADCLLARCLRRSRRHCAAPQRPRRRR